MIFVEDITVIIAGKCQLPTSFSAKDIACQTWSEKWHFVILCHVCGHVSQ